MKTTIYLIVTSFILYANLFGIISPVFSVVYNTQSVFGETTNALTLARILGSISGKLLGIYILPQIKKEKRMYWLMLFHILTTIPIIIFGTGHPIVQIVMIYISNVFAVLVWGPLLSYIEGRKYTDLIVIFLYLSFIVGTGVVKTIGASLLNAGVDINWMPSICASVSLVICIISLYFLDLSPEPTPSEHEQRQIRNASKIGEQNDFLKKYLLGFLSVTFVYSMVTAYRNFRDFFSVKIWQELLTPDFNANIYVFTDIPIGVGSTLIYSFLLCIKDERKSFFIVLLIHFPHIPGLLQYSPYSPVRHDLHEDGS